MKKMGKLQPEFKKMSLLLKYLIKNITWRRLLCRPYQLLFDKNLYPLSRSVAGYCPFFFKQISNGEWRTLERQLVEYIVEKEVIDDIVYTTHDSIVHREWGFKKNFLLF